MDERLRPAVVKTKTLEDLVMLASVMPVSVLNVYRAGEKLVAFTFLELLASSRPIVYVCRLSKPLDKKFAYVNRISGEISFGDSVSADANTVSIPVVNVESHDLFSESEI